MKGDACMKLLENPEKKLKQTVHVLGIICVILFAVTFIGCWIAFAAEIEGIPGLVIGLILAAVIAVFIFLWFWISLLCLQIYSGMAENIREQTEILRRTEAGTKRLPDTKTGPDAENGADS